MFELVDQFIYLSLFMFGAYITLYVKSRSYSGILLIACSILSNILIFSVVLDPFIFIALPITAVLLLADVVEDFKTGVVSRKHKIGLFIAIAIILYDILFVVQLTSFNIIHSFNLFTIGSVIGTLTGFYLVIYPFKEMMHEREQNLQRIANEQNMALTNEQKQLESSSASASLLDVVESQSSVEPQAESNNQTANSNQSKPKAKIFGIDILYLVVGAVVLLLLLGSIVYDFATRTVIDMQDYVFVTVEPDGFNQAKVDYYASFEHFDENNFYDELITRGQEYGLSPEQIETYTPVYTPENEEMFKKLDIKVALDKETASNGDVVTTNITYNQNYAMKNNIEIENTNFETEITNIPAYITTEVGSRDYQQLTDSAKDMISASKYSKKYDLSADPTCAQELVSEHLTITCSYDGQDAGLLGRSSETVSFRVTPYERDGEYYLLDDIEVVN